MEERAAVVDDVELEGAGKNSPGPPLEAMAEVELEEAPVATASTKFVLEEAP